MKKVVAFIGLNVIKTRNDCEIALDYVKHASVVLHVGLCKEIFASCRKHTATHKLTSAQPLTVTTMTHIHTSNNRLWSPYVQGGNKIASRCEAPRPPMTDVGTETAFRLNQRKHFRKVNIP